MIFAFIIGWARRLYQRYDQLGRGGRLRPGLVAGGYLTLLVGMMFFVS
ncbi:MAG: hypothetical protein ACLSH6_03360 [Limosilactobacillus pontis]